MSTVDEARLTVYGTATCADCRRSRALLDGAGVAYNYIGIEDDAAAADLVREKLGRISTPYIVFDDGHAVTEPSDDELRDELAQRGILPAS